VLVTGSRNVTSEDFSLVHRSNFLTESGSRNCVTHYFEVILALRIRVLVAGSRNVTSEDFSFVHRSNFCSCIMYSDTLRVSCVRHYLEVFLTLWILVRIRISESAL